MWYKITFHATPISFEKYKLVYLETKDFQLFSFACVHAYEDRFSGLCFLHGPSMFTVQAKIYGVPYNQSSSIAFIEISSYWSATKSS